MQSFLLRLGMDSAMRSQRSGVLAPYVFMDCSSSFCSSAVQGAGFIPVSRSWASAAAVCTGGGIKWTTEVVLMNCNAAVHTGGGIKWTTEVVLMNCNAAVHTGGGIKWITEVVLMNCNGDNTKWTIKEVLMNYNGDNIKWTMKIVSLSEL